MKIFGNLVMLICIFIALFGNLLGKTIIRNNYNDTLLKMRIKFSIKVTAVHDSQMADSLD